MNIADLTITSLETITAFDVVGGAYLFTLDELQTATIENTQDVEDITGKGGRKLAQLKRNKAVTVSGTNGMVSGGLLAAQTGTDLEHKVTTVQWTDYLTVNSNAATTSYKAVGPEGYELDKDENSLYLRNSDGTLGAKLEQAATASAGKFAYNPETKALTFSGLEDGQEVVAFYTRNIAADVVTNISDVYSKKAKLYVDAIAEDKCAKVYRVQFYIPKADFSGEFSIEMGDSQTVHEFSAESLAGVCGNNTTANLWTFTVFGANDADADADES